MKNQPQNQPQNPSGAKDPAPQVSPDLATAAAVRDAREDPKAPEEKKAYPERARVRTVTGDRMVHLITNQVIDGDERKIDLDAFAIAQIEAGKWQIVVD